MLANLNSASMCVVVMLIGATIGAATPEAMGAEKTEEQPNCKLHLPMPLSSVTCHTEGTFLQDLGKQCMKQMSADGIISQLCDGAPGHHGTEFLCSKFAVGENSCCTAGGVRYICAGDNGFVSAPEATDFDDCSQTCPGFENPEETTTAAAVTTIQSEATKTTTTEAPDIDQACQYHVFSSQLGVVSSKPMTCSTAGLAGQDGGHRCMRTKVTNMGVKMVVQHCDGARVSDGMMSICDKLGAVPNQCIEANGMQIICAGDGGFPSAPELTDFDNCGVTTTTTTTSIAIQKCEGWCKKNTNDWTSKCTWKSCNGCPQCSKEQEPKKCKNWCAGDSKPWTTKCTWKNCKECTECNANQEPTTTNCKNWCEDNGTDWDTKCTWKSCRKCNACSKNRRLQISSNNSPAGWNDDADSQMILV